MQNNRTNSLKLAPFALIFLILFAWVQKCSSQTKAEIIASKGVNYSEGKTDDGVPYICYVTRDKGFESVQSFYFDTDGKCVRRRLIEPLSEINGWVSTFNATKVKLDELKWKDYELDYTIEVTRNESTVTINFY